MTVDYAPYVVGNVVLSDHQAALAAATPSPTPAPSSSLTQRATAEGNALIQLTQPAPSEQLPGTVISNSIVSTADSGDLNPLDIASNAVAAGVGQAALAGLTALGHAIASGIVAFLKWVSSLAKAHIVPLAVAAVVLYLVFMR